MLVGGGGAVVVQIEVGIGFFIKNISGKMFVIAQNNKYI